MSINCCRQWRLSGMGSRQRRGCHPVGRKECLTERHRELRLHPHGYGSVHRANGQNGAEVWVCCFRSSGLYQDEEETPPGPRGLSEEKRGCDEVGRARGIFRYLILLLPPSLEWVSVHDPKGLAHGGEDDSNPGTRITSPGPSDCSGVEKNLISKVPLPPVGLRALLF